MRNLYGPWALILLTLGCWLGLSSCQQPKYITNQGLIHGTSYRITYEHPHGVDIQAEIDTSLRQFDLSLSTYIKHSLISRVNQNDPDVRVDDYMRLVLEKAREVHELSGGAFDMTVAPLINGYGFGFGEALDMDSATVDSLLELVGMEKVRLEGDLLVKADPRIQLDPNALAKGYSVDVIGHFLEGKGITDYMVEIGGEVVARGLNPKGQAWRIGVDRPIEQEPGQGQRELQAIIGLKDAAIATSGNYREFYIKEGRKYAHIIDPRTGYLAEHNLLSATVVAATCMEADAWATTFMVLGVEKSLALAQTLPDLECYLIFENEDGVFEVVQSPGFGQYVIKSDAFGL